ncbi:uncharacterized protein BP5553_04722 [Venustampulla echinocandica]|uniref:Copper acquisition factor BIM1-like domain-containing protein n=1 Tax=Venustampulla echinocandica TaxID=2656787 RepID=A0A370TP37_9HELO|nr:uncharacterized protein BP5553_04722 [Venustampulla echinocandica]RDL37289.1 hypothetical protein BP5553_04722 [Venustampulla echinocandica]
MKASLATLAALASAASAHFTLVYPAARGFNEDTLTNFPCGGQDKVSTTRTQWPLKDGSIALNMGHISTNVEVLIGFGNDVGSAFNTVLRPTFGQTGLGDFCITSVSLPAGLNITEGTNATIQVITNGDPKGGLYNCADITFASTVKAPTCANGTGITTGAATTSGHANGTALSGSGSDSGSSTTASTEPSASPTGDKKSAAVKALNAGLGGLVVAGAVVMAIAL